MNEPKNPAAVELGRIGGKTTSASKASAARKNGKKGGRPKLRDLRKKTLRKGAVQLPLRPR